MGKNQPKNIVVLSDGTGNSAAKFNKTNVWRTYEALDLSDPAKQVAVYDDGVGTESLRPLALLGGALGLGLSRNVRQLYGFVCRNYEPGDRIYGFGFSRGAFTIRTLAGFIAHAGILKGAPQMSPRELWHATTLLYRAYRKNHSNPQDGVKDEPVLTTAVRWVRDATVGRSLPSIQAQCDKSVEIEFLGLWDTVAAYGLPIDELTIGWDKWVWPLSMRNFDLSHKVKRAVHALSIDDERNTFHPLLWNENGDSGGTATADPVRQRPDAKNIADERLSQVWFAGMHADVGGGYPDDFLSYGPLNWVLEQARARDHLLFKPNKLTEYEAAARTMGVLHNSRQGLQSYYRLLPRKLEKLCDSRVSAIRWFRGLMPVMREQPASVVKIDRPKIHHSVFDRISAAGSGYAPIVLPPRYAVVMPAGTIENLGSKTRETADDAVQRTKDQELVWDLVWWRRVAYFTTIAATLMLAILPWLPKLVSARYLNWWPFEALTDGDKCIGSYFCFLSGLPKLASAFLPSFATSWIGAFAANPGIFGAFALFIWLLTRQSSKLDSRIQKSMRAIWNPEPNVQLRQSDEKSWLTRMRESALYQWLFKRLKYSWFPGVFGAASLLTIVYLSLFVVPSRLVFSLTDAAGWYCERAQARSINLATTADYAHFSFDPKSPCAATNIDLEKKGIYRVVVTVPDKGWDDSGLKADALGIYESHAKLKAIFAWPTKRYLFENYLMPVARILPRKSEKWAAGQDEYVLAPTLATTKEHLYCLVSDFEAQSSGQLHMFVNDAILYLAPDLIVGTYKNNNGKADVYVRRIAKVGESFAVPAQLPPNSDCAEFRSPSG